MKELKPISKEELIGRLKEIALLGWIENDIRKTNDGAAGNKLEDLLGIPENNLPIPNAAEWELKTQRNDTNSLLTLFHLEPSPRALKVVSSYLLPQYGWRHNKAGGTFPEDELSFRTTLNAGSFVRGFTLSVDGEQRKVCVKFDAAQVLQKDALWLESVERRNRDAEQIVPYWGFDDLFGKARTKLLNCFFVECETKREGGRTFFHYYKAQKLQGLNLDRFISAIEGGDIYIDFDARSGHNHGTKFRVKPAKVPSLYESAETVLDEAKLK